MAGLRQKQKLDRDRRIVEAAAALFREHGYDGARIEAIAERAGLSVGTIYNYYESKGDLLVAIVSLEVNEVIAAGEAVLADPPGDAADAVIALFDIYLRHSLHYLSKEMWRTAMAIATLTPGSREGAPLQRTRRGAVPAGDPPAAAVARPGDHPPGLQCRCGGAAAVQRHEHGLHRLRQE